MKQEEMINAIVASDKEFWAHMSMKEFDEYVEHLLRAYLNAIPLRALKVTYQAQVGQLKES